VGRIGGRTKNRVGSVLCCGSVGLSRAWGLSDFNSLMVVAKTIQDKMGAPRSWRAHRSGGGCGWQSPVDSYGLQYLDAGAVGVIIGASPAITAVLSALILKDVPFSRVWIGCAVSFIRVALVSGVNASDASGEKPLLGAQGGVILIRDECA